VRIDRQPRHYGREQILFLCPTCARPRYSLFVIGEQLTCRVCARLVYCSQRVPHRRAPALRRASKLRARFGSALFGSPPARPVWVRRDYYARWLAELSTWEARALEGAGNAAS
jgi:hypothetical protein